MIYRWEKQKLRVSTGWKTDEEFDVIIPITKIRAVVAFMTIYVWNRNVLICLKRCQCLFFSQKIFVIAKFRVSHETLSNQSSPFFNIFIHIHNSSSLIKTCKYSHSDAINSKSVFCSSIKELNFSENVMKLSILKTDFQHAARTVL